LRSSPSSLPSSLASLACAAVCGGGGAPGWKVLLLQYGHELKIHSSVLANLLRAVFHTGERAVKDAIDGAGEAAMDLQIID